MAFGLDQPTIGMRNSGKRSRASYSISTDWNASKPPMTTRPYAQNQRSNW